MNSKTIKMTLFAAIICVTSISQNIFATEETSTIKKSLEVTHSTDKINHKSLVNPWYAACGVGAVGVTLLNKWLVNRGEKHVDTFDQMKFQQLLKKLFNKTIAKSELNELISQIKAFFNDKVLGYRVKKSVNVKVLIPINDGQFAEIKDATVKNVKIRPSKGIGAAIDFLDELVDKDNIIVKIAMFMVFVKGLENAIQDETITGLEKQTLK